MNKPWLSANDKEVECFHPVCAQILENAMKSVGLDENYQVEHHRYIGSLEMDLVISNKETRKILCVIEVKRTIPAVYSTRYQYQAMSYVQSLRASEKESDYYILTNLECSCLFRYSQQRQNVYDQLIQPGIVFNHHFEDVPEEIFREDLTQQFREFLIKIINRDTNYVLSFSEFATKVKDSMPNLLKWNTSLAFMFYEYIRGSFAEIGRKGLTDIKRYRNDIVGICKEASQVNFNGIFGFPEQQYDEKYAPEQGLLSDLYKLGKNYKDADALCNIMHQVITQGRAHEGEIPTDIELAQTLVSIVKTFIPHLDTNQKITDPAAGSGTLLSAAVTGYASLSPSQIKANDINEKLIQLLTLRMGLCFAPTITKDNSPVISIKDIAEISKSFFDDTRIIVLNPPYLSAVSSDCINRKNKLSNRIHQLTGRLSKTNIGQAPLECTFIELLTHLVQPGTLIACILPNTHISALGAAEVVFRQFLLEEFGLSMIFNYPQTNLFDDVVQNTSIFVGQAHKPQEFVKFIQCLNVISELDQDTISQAVDNLKQSDESEELADGLLGRQVPFSELMKKVDEGWTFLDPVFCDVHSFVKEHIINNALFTCIENVNYKKQRGKVGNSGASDLLYINSKPNFYKKVKTEVAKYLKAGMRNADYENFIVGKGDKLFFDTTLVNDEVIKSVVQKYLVYSKSEISTTGRQKKNDKTEDQLIKILRKESRNYVPANTVLLPRASRKYASTYITTEKTFVSTNFVSIYTNNEKEAKMLSSWMSSIFYQLQLEIACKNQGGMRKLEVENINKTYVPQMQGISEEELDLITNTKIDDFYDLKKPQIREIDKVWAKILTKNDDVDDLLATALRYLTILAKTRES